MRLSGWAFALLFAVSFAPAQPQIPSQHPQRGNEFSSNNFKNFPTASSSLEAGSPSLITASTPTREWITPFNNAAADSDDVAFETALDASGNVYITGYSFNAAGNADIFTIKYNNAGVRQWTARYNGPGAGADVAYAIAVDGLGNVYVAGTSVNAAADSDLVVIKYNNAGVRQWVARYDGAGHGADVAFDLQLDDAGNVYAGGYARVDTVLFDMLTIKYDTDGVQQWLASYHGVGSVSATVRELAVDDAQNVYVTGHANGASGNSDFVTIKYDMSGVEQWVAFYNPLADSTDMSTDIALDSAGNVYVTGSSKNASGNFDYATLKYDNTGVRQWAARFDSEWHGADRANDVAVDAEGNVYVTGSSFRTGNEEDFATIKYNGAGVKQWNSRYNGPANGNDSAHRLVLDLAGNVYVTGTSKSASNLLDYTTLGYNNNGAQQWLVRHNGSGNGDDVAYDMAIDHQRNLYVTGAIKSANGNLDMATLKYSTLPKAGCAPSAKLFVVEAQGTSSTQVFRYSVQPNGAPILDLTLTHPSFDQPFGVAFSAEQELFIINRSAGGTGSVSRFFDAPGALLFNSTIASTAFNSPHGAVFHNNELFIAQNTGSNVLRHRFDILGNAIANGEITSGLSSNAPRGVAISPWGELFVTECCGVNEINRYTFDVNGNAIDNGVISGNGLGNPHDLEFSSWGELFVANLDSNSVSRFTFDGAHNAIANGTISGAALNGPAGLSFSSWNELFVSNHLGAGGVSRWVFDNAFQASANGSFATPTTLGDLEFLPEEELLFVNAGPDQQVTCGDSVQLGGSPAVIVGAPSYSYNWTPSTGLDNPFAANPKAAPSAKTTYILQVSDANGCVARDTVIVNVTALAAGWAVQHLTDVDDVIFGLDQNQQPNSSPRDVEALAVSANGRHLYLSYLLSHDKRVVRKVDAADPANNHAAVLAQLQFPNGTVPVLALATDDRGRVYISLQTEIRVYDSNLNALLHTITGFTDCEGIATRRESGKMSVYATDRADKTLERFELTEGLDETITAATKAGLDGDGEALIPNSINPRGVAIQSNGLIWVADNGANAVIRFYANGNFRGNTSVSKAYDLAIDASRNEVFVSQGTARTIKVLNVWNGQVKRTLTPPGAALNLDIDGDLGDGALTGIDVSACKRVFVANRRGRSLLTGDPLDSPFSNVGDNNDVKAADADPILIATGNVLAKDEGEEIVAEEEAPNIVKQYELSQNYPNPFNPETKITFALPQAGEVQLSIFSETGQLVRTLANRAMQPGRHELRWNGRNQEGRQVAAGVYLYRVIVKGENDEVVFSQTNRMTMLK